ncbi:MAG: hypothetical protein LBF72_03010 [Holosporales bacterium]|nr:hypothetical protein [Holosporales bacterium]
MVHFFALGKVAEQRKRTAQAEQHRTPGKVADSVGAPRDDPANFRWFGISGRKCAVLDDV